MVLLTAIVLNAVAPALGLAGWYQFFVQPSQPLSWWNYGYLFLVYPWILGWVSRLVK